MLWDFSKKNFFNGFAISDTNIMPYSLADLSDGLRILREEAINGTYELTPLEELSFDWLYEYGLVVGLSVWGLSVSLCCCWCCLQSRARLVNCNKLLLYLAHQYFS